RTGKRLWHYQIIHHNLWDWDLPAQPNLVSLHRNGKTIAAVAQMTKMGLLFIFDRVTGEPLNGIEERPVPQTNVPGEETWPTQPFPSTPSVARQTMTRDEVTSVTPESRRECLDIIDKALLGAVYQPPGLETTVIFPGTNGGPNWGGPSYDPRTNHLFVNSMDVGQVLKMVKAPAGNRIAYRSLGISQGRFWDSNQLPCQQPPWGTLTSIDLNTGGIRWRVPLGIVEALE